MHAQKITQNRKVVTGSGKLALYEGSALTYNQSGLSALDYSYIALRECLSGLSINDRYNVTRNFNRDELAERLRDYYTAESSIYALTDDEERTIISDTSSASREEYAKKLGYASWDEMVAAAESGKTIINGGVINTILINAEAIASDSAFLDKLLSNNAFIDQLISNEAFIKNLLVRRLRTNEPDSGTPRVEAEGNELTIYDKDGNPVLSINGEYYDTLEAFTDITGQQTSVAIMPETYIAETSGHVSVPAGVLTINNTVTKGSFDILNPGRSLVRCDLNLHVNVGFSNSSVVTIDYQSFYIFVTARNVDTDQKYNLGSANLNKNGSLLFSVQGVLPQGEYQIDIKFSASLAVTVTSATEANISMSVDPVSDAVVSIISERSEIFANGFGYRYNAQQYFTVMRPGGRSGTQSLMVVARVGSYMLRLSTSGLQKSTNGGTNWENL